MNSTMVNGNCQPLWRKTNQEIYHNSKVRIFPRVGLFKITYASKPIFREPGWEAMNPVKRENYDRGKMGENTRADSMRRAKMRVFDYAMLNDFQYFVTWTLDPAKIDRYDPKAVAKKMQEFLKNKVKHNALRYVIVPELHKDGAIHAHGFISGNFEMVPSGKRDRKGRTIYNMPGWKLGFSTAIKIDGDYEKACYYITKYVEKCDKIVFGNFYYAGGHGLIRHPDRIVFDSEFTEIEARQYSVKEAGVAFKYQDDKQDPSEN